MSLAQGRQRSEWQQTAAVLCLLANVNRDPKKQSRPFRPDDFDPFRAGSGGAGGRVGMDELKAALRRRRD